MKRKHKHINLLWILALVVFYSIVLIYFGYNFLFSEELHLNDQSVEDELVSSHESWVKHLLSPSEPNTSQIMYSQTYGQYLHLEQHCNKTITKSKPKFSKLVLFIIDAFRVDFVSSISSNLKHYTLPYMEQVMKTHGLGLTSVASIPTVTLPRVKALISGTLPSFMDYIMNLNVYKFKNDNIVEQLWRKNKKIVFYGDDTWAKLFSNDIFYRMNVTSSLFATDYTEVDSNVTYNVNKELKNLPDWDVMILHYLGVDHIGHLRGFNSDLFPAKLHEMDEVFRNIFDTLTYSTKAENDSYLIVVAGDHGMTNGGNHGGNTRDETNTAMIFVSTDKNHVDPTGSRAQLSKQTVLQIDFATTIASLFNFDLFPKNQGRLISNVLDRFNVPKEEHLCMLYRNAFQVQKLVNKEQINSNHLKTILIEALKGHYQTMNVHEPSDQEEYFVRSKELYQNFIKQVQQQFINKTTNRSIFSSLTASIIICYIIVICLLWHEFNYNRTSSIFFSHNFSFFTLFNVNHWIQSLQSVFGQNVYGSHSLSKLNLINCFSHLRFFSSFSGMVIILLLLMLNVVLMGSTSFMEYEHYYWYYITQLILVLKLLVTVGGFLNFSASNFKSTDVSQHYLKVIYSIVAVILLFKLCTMWRVTVVTERDIQQTDVHSWLLLKSSKHILSAILLISLFSIVALIWNKSFIRSHYICASALFWVYLYRSQLGSVSTLKIPMLHQFLVSSKNPNVAAQIVFIHILFITADCVWNKLKQFLPTKIIRGSLVKKIANIVNGFKVNSTQTNFNSSNSTSKQNECTFLNTLLILWITMSILLLEPTMVPIMMFNILLEKLLYLIFSCPSFLSSLTHNNSDNQRILYRQIFYRLATYTAFAYSGFYQIGNTNSLSSISVTSCFIGLNSYQPVFCTIFMVISIYSTYIYWYIMFFIRLQQDFFSIEIKELLPPEMWSQPKENHRQQPIINIEMSDSNKELVLTRLKNQIVLNYCTFYSVLNTVLFLRLSVMAVNMMITLLLRDHLFIWSVICPKFMYEFCFTILNQIFLLTMVAVYTADNLFLLN